MNKYVIIGIVVVVFVGAGALFKAFKGDSGNVVQSTGKTVEVTVKAVKDEWRWDVEKIQVNAGDTVKLTFVNEDNYDHGIGIDGYGVNERMPADKTITVDFVATRKGKFSFYCSVPCGKGTVNGEDRDHFDMLGELEVI